MPDKVFILFQLVQNPKCFPAFAPQLRTGRRVIVKVAWVTVEMLTNEGVQVADQVVEILQSARRRSAIEP
ncbi:hypothetical protein RS1P1_03770 [Pseudomonas moraviensis]|nr:hypothetical protein RS1P1_03770 [Pseudomonas moraviensis]